MVRKVGKAGSRMTVHNRDAGGGDGGMSIHRDYLVEQTEALHLVSRDYQTVYPVRLTMSSSDSSLASSFFSSSLAASGAASSAAPPAPAAATAAPAAGAPPPPTLVSMSLMFFPSRALARREAQIGSSSTLAAVVRVVIFSPCCVHQHLL